MFVDQRRRAEKPEASGDNPGEPDKEAGDAAEAGARRRTDGLEAARQVLLLHWRGEGRAAAGGTAAGASGN